MTTKEQIKEFEEKANEWLDNLNIIDTIMVNDIVEYKISKIKQQLKKSLPTHPNKMLSRKEVIDIINKI